jgi:hypothetical protein
MEPGHPDELALLSLVPSAIAVAPGAARNVRAVATDERARRIEQGLEFRWALEDPSLARLEAGEGPGARLVASEREGTTRLRVAAIAPSGRRAEASGELVVRVPPVRTASGVPTPILVEEPGTRWRSRFREGRWEVNSGHADYRVVEDSRERRLQYFVLLLAREIAHRAEGRDARVGDALESLIEVAAYALRQV